MASRTLCTECSNCVLVDTLADAPPDAVRVVLQGGAPHCLAEEMLINPVTGLSRLPPLCVDVNLVGACPWFRSRKDSESPARDGDLRVRGRVEWIEPEKASGGVIPGLSDADLDALRSREARQVLPRPPFPPPPPQEAVSAEIVISNEIGEVKK